MVKLCLKKGGVVIVIVWLLSAVTTMGMDDPPATVVLDTLQELYEPVEFDHEMHMEGYDCETCHHHTTGNGTEHPVCGRCHANTLSSEEVGCIKCHGATTHSVEEDIPTIYHIDKPGLKGALHLQCIGCHRQEGGTIGCRGCHELTDAGRKRFHLETTD